MMGLNDRLTWLRRVESRDAQGRWQVDWQEAGPVFGQIQLRLPAGAPDAPYDVSAVTGRAWLPGHLALKVGDRLRHAGLDYELRALLPAAGPNGLQQVRLEAVRPEAAP
ncbi:hypothetical protein [Fodinicurvata sediminis]|uniref:hypothetical protein n=1 Tax=Fodinicurvata sediminis TaxID=1121832 RepID=UPI0003B5CA54|nr:hypothetical protein [Fodinicurvata sediminis]